MPRTAGSHNKNKAFTLKKLQDMWGKDFNPLMKASESAYRMSQIAEASHDTEEEFMRHKECVAAWEKVAQYIQPKLKAVEVSGNEDKPLNGKWSIEFVNASPQDQ